MSLKRFNDFKLESNKYSRIQTFGVISYMNMYLTGGRNSLRILEPELPEEVDKFFGAGTWEKSKETAIKIRDKINGVDIGYIEDRIQELEDYEGIDNLSVYVGFVVLDQEFRNDFNLPKNKDRVLSSHYMITSNLCWDPEDFLSESYLSYIIIRIVLDIWKSAPFYKREELRQWREAEERRTGLLVKDKPLDHKWEVDRVLDLIYPSINLRVRSKTQKSVDFFKEKISGVIGGVLSSLDPLGSVWDKDNEFEYTSRFGVTIVLK